MLARAVLDQVPRARFVFAGTADAYGPSFRSGAVLDEGAALAPQNTYGATKAAADLALGAMAAEGLRVVRARPFNHTGPGQSGAVRRCRPSRSRSPQSPRGGRRR